MAMLAVVGASAGCDAEPEEFAPQAHSEVLDDGEFRSGGSDWDQVWNAGLDPEDAGLVISNTNGCLAREVMSDGTFRLDTDTGSGSSCNFKHTCPSDPVDGFTLEARVRVAEVVGSTQYGGIGLWAASMDSEVNLILREDSVLAKQGGMTHAIDTTDDFHTYRLVVEDDGYDVYIDGAGPLLSGTTVDKNRSFFSFGDGSSMAGGEAQWDYVAMDCGGAFSPAELSSPQRLTVCAGGCDHDTVQTAIVDAEPGDRLLLAGETFTGPLVIDKDLTLERLGGATPTIDAAAGDAAIRIESGTEVMLEFLNVVGGTGESGITNFGTLTLEGVYVTDNHTMYGGIFNAHDLTISGGAIMDNSSTQGMAGGLNNIGGTVDIDDVTFVANEGYDGGGLLSVGPTADVTIANTSFSGNSASIGGGISNISGALHITGSNFTSNHADVGGGWSNRQPGGTVTTQSVGYANNSATHSSSANCYDVSGANDCP